MSRTITRHIDLSASADDVFQLLLRPSLIKKWWGTSSEVILAEEEGIYALAWGEDADDPDYITVARIRNFNPPFRFDLVEYTYRSREESPEFVKDLWVRFEVQPIENGSRLIVHNFGFPNGPHADEFYEGCETGWNTTLDNISKLFIL